MRNVNVAADIIVALLVVFSTGTSVLVSGLLSPSVFESPPAPWSVGAVAAASHVSQSFLALQASESTGSQIAGLLVAAPAGTEPRSMKYLNND